MSLLAYDIFLIFRSALVCTKDHYAELFSNALDISRKTLLTYNSGFALQMSWVVEMS